MVKIFVGNLVDSGVSEKVLKDEFSGYGQVKEVAMFEKFAFVHMASLSEAQEAIERLNGCVIGDGSRPITVEMSNSDSAGKKRLGAPRDRSPSPPRKHSNKAGPSDTKLFVGNLENCDITEGELEELFSSYGEVTEATKMGAYAFIHMSDREAARRAVQGLDRTTHHDTKLRVEFSTGRRSRDEELPPAGLATSEPSPYRAAAAPDQYYLDPVYRAPHLDYSGVVRAPHPDYAGGVTQAPQHPDYAAGGVTLAPHPDYGGVSRAPHPDYGGTPRYHPSAVPLRDPLSQPAATRSMLPPSALDRFDPLPHSPAADIRAKREPSQGLRGLAATESTRLVRREPHYQDVFHPPPPYPPPTVVVVDTRGRTLATYGPGAYVAPARDPRDPPAPHYELAPRGDPAYESDAAFLARVTHPAARQVRSTDVRPDESEIPPEHRAPKDARSVLTSANKRAAEGHTPEAAQYDANSTHGLTSASEDIENQDMYTDEVQYGETRRAAHLSSAQSSVDQRLAQPPPTNTIRYLY